MFNLRFKFLRTLAKINVWKDRSFVTKNKITDNQRLAYDIIKKCIANKKCLLLLAPITNAYYVQLDDLFIKIMDNHVQIVNGKYFYHINMPEYLIADLDKRFRNKVESKKNSIEDKIYCNTKASLTSIFEDLSYEKNASATLTKL